jgi:hypothetical protein
MKQLRRQVIVSLIVSGAIFGQPMQKRMSVDDIVEMSKAGMSESLVITKLRKEGQAFDLKPADMVRLKQSGVTDAVMQAMLDPSAPTSNTPTVAAPSNPTLDTGVYFRKDGKWAEVLPEVVNWKTGGVLKSIASAGIVKGDVNGNIEGPNSRNSVKSPLEFMVVTAEGIAITEYQLIRMRPNREYREFRTVTGGVMHVKGGATRDLVPFEHKKTATRTYEIILPSNIGAGEYGFLPPGAVSSANSASMGKMFSFRVLE